MKMIVNSVNNLTPAASTKIRPSYRDRNEECKVRPCHECCSNDALPSFIVEEDAVASNYYLYRIIMMASVRELMDSTWTSFHQWSHLTLHNHRSRRNNVFKSYFNDYIDTPPQSKNQKRKSSLHRPSPSWHNLSLFLVTFILATTHPIHCFTVPYCTSSTTLKRLYSFISPRSSSPRYSTDNSPRSISFLHARASSPVDSKDTTTSASLSSSTTIQSVQPLTTTSMERRLSAQMAWNKVNKLSSPFDNNTQSSTTNNFSDMGSTTTTTTTSSNSFTPNSSSSSQPSTNDILDYFSAAISDGIKSSQNSMSSSPSNGQKHTRPRGRPESVPGAMSRTTLMNMNEFNNGSNGFSANVNNMGGGNYISASSSRMDGSFSSSETTSYTSYSYSNTSFDNTNNDNDIASNYVTTMPSYNTNFSESIDSMNDDNTVSDRDVNEIKSNKMMTRKSIKKATTSRKTRVVSSIKTSTTKPLPKIRGRGRPKKNPSPISSDVSDENNPSLLNDLNEFSSMSDNLLQGSNRNQVDSETLRSSAPFNDYYDDTDTDEQQRTSSTVKRRKPTVKNLPASRKELEEEGKDSETTGMMPSMSRKEIMAKKSEALSASANGSNGSATIASSSSSSSTSTDYNDPPNLQRYYRTELLSRQEEYSLGMKIQLMMKCESVHEGLYQLLGRTPSISEWAHACGYREFDEEMSKPNYKETDIVSEIRPTNSEAWDEGQDPNMFVGNGLANANGPGRGRGRVKKPPPTFLKDFYDDTSIRFHPRNRDLDNSNDTSSSGYVHLDEEPQSVEQDFEDDSLLTKLRPVNRGSPRDFYNMMLDGKESKQRMVQCNMRLVVSISKRYKHVGVNIADLVQEGSIGLTRAAEKFDPKKGFKFSTYASWWIQQAVFRSIAYHSRTIRLPVHVHNMLNRIRRVRLDLQRIFNRPPTNEEMATELGMSVVKYNKMLRLTRKAISLDMAKYQNNPKDIGQESETSLGDTIDAAEVIKDENTPEQNVDQVLFRDDLKEMLTILGDDERAVISARYGLEDGLTRTVTSVAVLMGQSKSWVRSQECRALRKLRRPWYEKRLWEHQNSLTN